MLPSSPSNIRVYPSSYYLSKQEPKKKKGKRGTTGEPTNRPLSSSFFDGLYLESYKVIPKRNSLEAYG